MLGGSCCHPSQDKVVFERQIPKSENRLDRAVENISKKQTAFISKGEESTPKVRFLYSVFLLAGLVAMLMSIVRWQNNNVMLGAIDLCFAVISFSLLFYLRRNKYKIEYISSLALLLCFILFVAVYVLAPLNPMRLSLFFLLTASAFFLKGRNAGRIYLACILLTIMAVHFSGYFATGYTTLDVLSTCVYLFAQLVIFENYESFKELERVRRHSEAEARAEREKAERALSESEVKYRELVENANSIILRMDNKGIVTFINEFAQRFFGYSEEKIIGKNAVGTIFPPVETAGRDLKVMIEDIALNPDRYASNINENMRRGGERVWIAWTNKPIRYENGRVMEVLCVGNDITERKLAEEALKESQQQLADIIDFLPEATLVIDREGKIIAWNRAIEEMTGIKAAEMLGKDNYEYSLPFYGERRPILVDLALQPQPEIEQRYAALEKTATVVAGEAYMPALGGGGVFLHGTASALYDSKGNVVGAIESIRDITRRKLAEDALRESEERFSKFFHASPIGTSIIRLSDRQFTNVNDTFLRWTGYKREEVIGHTLLELEIWPNLEVRARMVEMLLGQGRIVDFETQSRKKSGEIRDMIISADVIELSGEKYILGLAHDITERKRAGEEKEKLEAQLFQAQKMESVGRLAGGVAHDFNNMLGVIIGRAEMALDRDIPLDKLRRNLQEILKAGQRSADLTRQLLAFARKQTAVPKTLDLNDTISGMLKMLRRLIGEDIDLLWVPGLDLWKVKIDPSQVDQILANLAVNARDAISGVGTITLRTENAVIDDSGGEYTEFVPGQYVLLTFSDTGAGMSNDVLEKVFEPFFTTKEVGKGTGLGLSTVYGVVKQNDGFVYAASQPGKGATFKIYLPRCDAEIAQVSSEESAGRLPKGTETILLVEDDEAMLNLSSMMLEELGYTVLAARTPLRAMQLVEEYPGDLHLLITDVVMPGMNGRELAERLSAFRPNLKCLYMSGHTANVIAHRGVLDEGVNFIPKPFQFGDLAGKVRQVLYHLE